MLLSLLLLLCCLCVISWAYTVFRQFFYSTCAPIFPITLSMVIFEKNQQNLRKVAKESARAKDKEKSHMCICMVPRVTHNCIDWIIIALGFVMSFNSNCSQFVYLAKNQMIVDAYAPPITYHLHIRLILWLFLLLSSFVCVCVAQLLN